MPRFIREKRWRCSSCREYVLGRYKECQNCGQPKGREKFEARPGAQAITNPELLRQARAGRDWECVYCKSHQRRDSGECVQCGAPNQAEALERLKREQEPRVVGKARYPKPVPEPRKVKPKVWPPKPDPIESEHVRQERERERDAEIEKRIRRVKGKGFRGAEKLPDPVEDSTPPVVEAIEPVEIAPPAIPAGPRPWPGRWWDRRRRVTAAVVLGVLSLSVLCFVLFRTRVVEGTVTALAWTHTVKVERKEVHTGEGFDENMPRGAFDVKEVGRRHHHDDHYPCGETPVVCTPIPETCYTTPVSCTDMGNGFESCSGGDEVCSSGGESCSGGDTIYCDDPVYEMWYSWRVWKWTPNRSVVAKGTTDEPYWPTKDEIALGKGLSTRVENGQTEEERESRSTRYEVEFTDTESETHNYTPVGLDEFMRLRPGSKRRIRVGILRKTQVLGE